MSLSHPFSPYLTLSHPISPFLTTVPPYLTLSDPISLVSRPISPYLTLSHPIPISPFLTLSHPFSRQYCLPTHHYNTSHANLSQKALFTRSPPPPGPQLKGKVRVAWRVACGWGGGDFEYMSKRVFKKMSSQPPQHSPTLRESSKRDPRDLIMHGSARLSQAAPVLLRRLCCLVPGAAVLHLCARARAV